MGHRHRFAVVADGGAGVTQARAPDAFGTVVLLATTAWCGVRSTEEAFADAAWLIANGADVFVTDSALGCVRLANDVPTVPHAHVLGTDRAATA